MPTDLLTHTPTPAQVRASREAAGLSMDAAAALVGLPGRGAWWRMETETVHQRPIDPRLWALWLLATDQHPGYRAMPTRRRAQQNEALQELADHSQTYGAKGF